MQLLSGPAGSGKTTYILDRLRQSLSSGSSKTRLLVPTATMAQHLQNRLAREGFIFPASLIQTISTFIRDYVSNANEVSAAVLHLLVEEAAQHVARPEFSRVTRFHGFCNSLTHTIEEFASAGCDSTRLAECLPDAPLADAFLAVYQEVDRQLARRSLAMRARRLEIAAAQIAAHGLNAIGTIYMDGFHALPDPELRVVAAMSRHADLTLTLGDEDFTPALRARLDAIGFTEERQPARRTRPAIALVKAPGIEREIEEIARRILLQADSGRPFREMGIIVRSPEIYAPALRSTLERFGIPARFYFDTPLEREFMSGRLGGLRGAEEIAQSGKAGRPVLGSEDECAPLFERGERIQLVEETLGAGARLAFLAEQQRAQPAESGVGRLLAYCEIEAIRHRKIGETGGEAEDGQGARVIPTAEHGFDRS